MTGTTDVATEVVGAATAASERLQRLYGSRDLEAFFAGHDRVIVPWTEAPRAARQPRVDPTAAAEMLAGPPRIVDVDPRILHATQSWVVAHHARYYLTGEWERTGLPSAERHLGSNRYPLVADVDGRAVLFGGHHRALVALIAGRPLRARVARTSADQPVAVTPRLIVADCSRPTLGLSYTCLTPEFAATLVERDRTAIVAVPGVAFETLRRLGLEAEEALERLWMAKLLTRPSEVSEL